MLISNLYYEIALKFYPSLPIIISIMTVMGPAIVSSGLTTLAVPDGIISLNQNEYGI